MTEPFVTIVLPALNEEAFIEDAIRTVTPADVDFAYEIIVADGGSTDRTRPLVDALARQDGRIRLIDNPKRLQSAGVNLAARSANPAATILVRADCHAIYPPGFVQRCVSELSHRYAQSIVVPMRTVGTAPLQRAIAATQNSLLGNGGSAHRRGTRSGQVEHGHHAAFDLVWFLGLGGYDESFSHNEDAELDVRITRLGGRIWLDTDNAVTYFPRRTLPALARQYFKHGAGRGRTALKHATRPKLRQLAPIAILSAWVGGAALAPVSPLFLAPALLYAAACCGVGAGHAIRTGDPALLAMGPAAMTMHLAWACGFLRTLATHRRPPVEPAAAAESQGRPEMAAMVNSGSAGLPEELDTR